MKLSAAFEASIALSFGDVSDAYQFFPSTLGISDNPDYRANLQHCRITDIDYKRNHAGVSDHVRQRIGADHGGLVDRHKSRDRGMNMRCKRDQRHGREGEQDAEGDGSAPLAAGGRRGRQRRAVVWPCRYRLGHCNPILAHERLKIWPRSTTLAQRRLWMGVASFARIGISAV